MCIRITDVSLLYIFCFVNYIFYYLSIDLLFEYFYTVFRKYCFLFLNSIIIWEV